MASWVLVVVAVLGWGLWAVAEKLAVKSMSPLLVQLTAAYVYSAIAPVAFLVMKGRNDPFEWTSPGIAWASAATLCACTATYAFLFLVQRVETSVAVGYTSPYPLVALLASAAFLDEDITANKVVGMVLVVLGTCLVVR